MRSASNFPGSVAVFVAGVSLITLTCAEETSEEPGASKPQITQTRADGLSPEMEVLLLTNKERTAQGLQPLEWSRELAAAAHSHAEDMFSEAYFSHFSHDRIGGRLVEVASPSERLLSHSMRACAENIAQGQSKPEEVVRQWMASEGHRSNILAKDHRLCGVGFAGGYWVQVFGR